MPSQLSHTHANGTEDTLRVLVATDNHVGYNERDPVRGDDSWRTFHEIMCLAKKRDVDLVLFGGDLFHDNVPSRKSMYNVMRSLRLNCYGDKPCEVQILSDSTEHFDPSIGHANYEDTNINVALPVFSIHGNHDDPSGDGHFAALDILEMSGLLNYFGRVPVSDEIHVRPVLLQKGSTKLALYGLSNVRDERMYRSFRDDKVKFYQSKVQQKDWYNLCVVHQNHAAHGPTSYLPENFLPDFLDLVVWGHEHECIIRPRINAEMDFKVMQPGSSVATSLSPGEAVPKHVAILSITGREMTCEPIRLKTVRPFVYKEIALSTQKDAMKIARQTNHRHKLTQWLMSRVDQLIAEANQQWKEAQEEDEERDEDEEPPLPLIRLRVEHSSSDGTKFEVENPQRFSQRFAGRVANTNDVVQFHIKKKAASAMRLKANEDLKKFMDQPEVAETIKVSRLVAESLATQSLTILPQNYFGDAVNQYIDKDDKHAMDIFINESLAKQLGHLVSMGEGDNGEDIDLTEQFETYRTQLEEMFQRGQLNTRIGGKRRFKPKPADWDSDDQGAWEDEPAALIRSDDDRDSDDDMFDDSDATPQTSTRGGSKGRARRGGGTTSTRARGGAKRPIANPRGQPKKKPISDDSEEEDEGAVMVNDDEIDSPSNDSDSQAMFFTESKPKKAKVAARNGATGAVAAVKPAAKSRTAATTTIAATKSSARPSAPASTRKAPSRAAVAAAATSKPAKQSTLSFSASQASVLGGGGRSQNAAISDIDDDDDDDDDAFEPVTATATRNTRSKRR